MTISLSCPTSDDLQVWADWAAVLSGIAAAIAIVVTLLIASGARRHAIQDRRGLFETEILKELLETIPDPDSEEHRPNERTTLITTRQFELVAMIY